MTRPRPLKIGRSTSSWSVGVLVKSQLKAIRKGLANESADDSRHAWETERKAGRGTPAALRQRLWLHARDRDGARPALAPQPRCSRCSAHCTTSCAEPLIKDIGIERTNNTSYYIPATTSACSTTLSASGNLRSRWASHSPSSRKHFPHALNSPRRIYPTCLGALSSSPAPTPVLGRRRSRYCHHSADRKVTRC